MYADGCHHRLLRREAVTELRRVATDAVRRASGAPVGWKRLTTASSFLVRGTELDTMRYGLAYYVSPRTVPVAGAVVATSIWRNVDEACARTVHG